MVNNNKPNNQGKGLPRRKPNNNQDRRPHKPKFSEVATSEDSTPMKYGISRGAAIRAQKRTHDDANKALEQYVTLSDKSAKPRRANVVADDFEKLKISFLGGQEAIGEKNMQVVEWQNEAIILDCGNNLGVDLPGVNYTIADTSYLETIKHKIKGYVITHGHLDHLGGLKHIAPLYPAPIYGSRFTLGVIEKTFEDMDPELASTYTPQFVPMNIDNHEKLKIGPFMIELVRITHSVPESTCIVVDTPVGRIINTGDWRLDPEPLDDKPTDVERLRQLGDEGVLLLMSDSCNTPLPGRTPTEHTLQESFHDIIGRAEGRVFVAIFSSNMNRVQMIINSAVQAGRYVALDGRSMMSYAEIAVRQGLLKVPKGMIKAMRDVASMPDNKILIICTGGQGEPNAALQRMAEGNHKHIKLHPGDTVVVSSTPIPGNEVRYEQIGNDLAKRGVHLYRHPTHEVDGVGPLHVSGHARRDEYREMLHIIRPKFFLPIYAGFLNRRYYAEMAIEEGWNRKNILLAENGDAVYLTKETAEIGGEVPHGNVLVDQTGSVVSGVVVKDRLLLAEEGLVAVVLTIDKKTGVLLTSPDIISRGFIYMRDSEELMNAFRAELKRAVQQRFKRVDLDRFKQEIKEHVTHFLFEHTSRSPIVIPVVNVIGGKQGGNGNGGEKTKQGAAVTVPQQQETTPEQIAAEQQRRFEEMRAKLLGQEPKG
jgi:ribonuclease J